MKLTDLNPSWIIAGGDGIRDKDGNPVPKRTGIGMMFDCPCGSCDERSYVSFSNPLDGGDPCLNNPKESSWHRNGDTFETMTLNPSIRSVKEKGGCGWHGWIRNGVVTSC